MAEKLQFILQAKDEFSGALSNITSKLPSLGTMAAGAAAGITSAGAALFAMAKSAADAYDAIADTSRQLGISTEFISKMNYAAIQNGMNNQEMANSLKFLSVRLGEAAKGEETAKEAFDALGISVRDASGKIRSAEEIMPELAEGFKNIESGAERASLAQDLMSRAGTKMVPILAQGEDGLKALADEAEKFGLVVSTKAADNASEFNDSLDRMKGSISGVKNKMVEDLFPVIAQGFNSMADIIADNRETITRWAGVVVDYLGKAAEFTAYAGGVIVDAFRGIHAVWELTKGGLARWVQFFFEAIAKITGKAADFMEALNFKGIFDGPIAKARSFQATMFNVGDSVGSVADKSAQEVAEYWEGGMGKATKAVGGFIDKFKEGMRSISKEDNVAGAGTESSIVDENAVKAMAEKEKAYQTAYDQLLGLHQQYTLSEEEQLQAWYDKQAEIFTGHADAMLILDETFYARQNEMRAAQQEAVNAAWEEAVLSDEEKLNLWYERQLEMYEGNAIAKGQVDDIYAAKKAAFDKKTADKASKDQKAALEGTLALARVFGGKAVALAQAIAIPKMIMDAWEASANAMKDFPFPTNIGIAAGQFAAVMGMVAQVRSVTMGGIAHGGIDYVPRESSYLLDRGERVLSPRQNQDLTEFLESGGGSSFTIESPHFHFFENARDLDTMLSMDKQDWQEVVYDKIVPALSDLARMGIKVKPR